MMGVAAFWLFYVNASKQCKGIYGISRILFRKKL